MADKSEPNLGQYLDRMLDNELIQAEQLWSLLDFQCELFGRQILRYDPVAGDVLWCHFTPELNDKIHEIKGSRPVIIVSPKSQDRTDLYNIVPLSTTKPDPAQSFHHYFPAGSIPGLTLQDRWLKADAACQVSRRRLDRVPSKQHDGRTKWKILKLTQRQLLDVRCCILRAFGFGDLTKHLVAPM